MTKIYNALSNSDMFQLFSDYSGDYFAPSSASVLIYAVQGIAKITVEDQNNIISIDDFLVVNRGILAKIESQSKNTVLCFVYLGSALVREVVGTNNYSFECNSIVQSSMNHDDVRQLLKRMISLSEIDEKKYNTRSLLMKSTYFELINIIIQKYFVRSATTTSTNNNFTDALDYIHSNYYRKITLDDVADYAFMSKSYFSRFFKKEMGINFVNYLKNYRVKQSLSYLIATENSITQIALDVGFSSTSSYNVAFKEVFDKTPTEYRSEAKEEIVFPKETVTISDLNIPNIDVSSLVWSQENNEYLNYHFDSKAKSEIHLLTNQYMNVGHIKHLVDGNFQNHLKDVSRSLSLKGLVISNLFDKQEIETVVSHNFRQYRSVFDFVIENKFDVIFQIEVNEGEIDWLGKYLNDLLRYLISSSNTIHLDKFSFNLKYNFEDDIDKLIEYSKTLINIIRKYSKKSKVGAPNFDLYSVKDLKAYSHNFFDLDIDFISCSFFDRDSTRTLISLESYIKEIKSQITKQNKKLADNIYIIEYNTSQNVPENKNFVHDSITKAAQVVSDLIGMVELVKVVAYSPISDFSLPYVNDSSILDGGGGLTATNGLYKPVFYAFKFMRHIGSILIKRTKSFLATSDENNNFAIIAHNFNKNSINKEILESFKIMRNTQKLNTGLKKVLGITIEDVEDGIYEVRTYSINETKGNVLQEWSKWGFIDYFRKGDIDYLRSLARPSLMIQTIQVQESKLYLDIELESNEISITYIDRIRL